MKGDAASADDELQPVFLNITTQKKMYLVANLASRKNGIFKLL